MQPYFFPYLGYFQLINAVDTFVVYDNIQYTKKGFVKRNYFLQNGKPAVFSIPVKKDSCYLDIEKRMVCETFNRRKLLNQINNAYQKAPYYEQAFDLFKRVLINHRKNLFQFIYNSIIETCEFLEIETKIIISSTINIDHTLRSQDKVIAICKQLYAGTYINPIGGIELYNKEAFQKERIALKFIKMKDIEYKQYDNQFVPCLSILDVMMFNSKEKIKALLKQYTFLF